MRSVYNQSLCSAYKELEVTTYFSQKVSEVG